MIDIKEKSLKGYTFIDLFAGLGGFHLALESLGAECVYANEWDVPAQNVYNTNFGILPEGDELPLLPKLTELTRGGRTLTVSQPFHTAF